MIAVVIERVLQNLHIPYTHKYLNEYMEILPLNDTLWAIKKVLDHYGINNATVSIADRNKIVEIDRQFITQLHGEFVLVETITANQVTYFNSKGTYKISTNDFLRDWAGIIMLYESTSSSAEPNYTTNRKVRLRNNSNKYLTLMTLITLLLLAISRIYESELICVELALSLFGLGLSLLLLKRDLHIPSPTSEKLCNIIGHSKCDEHVDVQLMGPNVLNNLKLSELGISFFGINVMALLLFPYNSIPVIFLSLLLALPLSLWSIGWQLVKRSWCILCVLVMVSLWVALGILLYKSHILITKDIAIQFIATLCCYWLSVNVIHFLSAQRTMVDLKKRRINTLQRVKYDKGNWNAILASYKTSHPIDIDSSSSLIFSNDDTELPLITVVGNPFCNPCARMHHRLQPLLDAGFPIQYVFTYFNLDLASVNSKIVESFILNGPEKTWELLTSWYKGDRTSHPFSIRNESPVSNEINQQVVSELKKQNRWVENTGISATPTILVAGKAMPRHYVIEDLLYIY